MQIDLTARRCHVPGDAPGATRPCLVVTPEWPDRDWIAMECQGICAPDVVADCTSAIWFEDRDGWAAAWRLGRALRKGRPLTDADLKAVTAPITCHFSKVHYLGEAAPRDQSVPRKQMRISLEDAVSRALNPKAVE